MPRLETHMSPPGDPRADIGTGFYCLIPTTVLETSRIQKVFNTCPMMPVTTESVGGERVVPTTQTRLTPVGQEHQTEVTRVSEEELDTTEGEGVDFLTELLDLTGWPQVNDEETEKDLS